MNGVLREGILSEWNCSWDKWQVEEWITLVISRQIRTANERRHVSIQPESSTVIHHIRLLSKDLGEVTILELRVEWIQAHSLLAISQIDKQGIILYVAHDCQICIDHQVS